MQRNAPILVLVAVTIGLGMLAAGRDNRTTNSKPDFSGKWELNVAKSKFGKMPVPTRMTLEATRKGDSMHSVQTSYDQAGGPNAVEGEWYLDGRERPMSSDGKMISASRWDGDTLVSERKSKDGAYHEVIRLSISGDGKTATEDIRTKNPNGDNHSTLVWERR
jgi:hypothetical protein